MNSMLIPPGHRFENSFYDAQDENKRLIPLGQYEDFDLYAYIQGMPDKSEIQAFHSRTLNDKFLLTFGARYGNDGPEYLSGKDEIDGPLHHAEQRYYELNSQAEVSK